jgi:hypothetical protein
MDTGDYQLTISPKEQGETYLMYLHSIFLEPAEKIKNEGWEN